jgi:hypothetical protein
MLLYDKRAGAIAQAYAIARSSELPHFDKNAKYIAQWFKTMLEAGFENHRAICIEHLAGFSVRFAELASWKAAKDDPDEPPPLPIQEDLFDHMCYIFVIYEAYTNGFKVNRFLPERVSAHAAKLGLQEQEMFWFFKKVIDDVWLLHTHKSQEKEQSLLSA